MSIEHPAAVPLGEDLFAAKEAALFGTFYGEPEYIKRVLARIHMSLEWKKGTHGRYWYTDEGDILRCYECIAHDTSAVQLVLQAPAPAAAPSAATPDEQAAESLPAVAAEWRRQRQRLEAMLCDEALLEKLWGYTLVYQAEAAAKISPEVIAFHKVVDEVHALRGEPQRPFEKLAQDHVADGLIWLADVALGGDGSAAASVYLALSEPGHTGEFNKSYLLGRTAKLLMLDLIAHKSYHQRREFALADPSGNYSQQVTTTLLQTSQLLARVEKNKSSEREVAALAGSYLPLLRSVPWLEALRISLLQQLYNYRQRRRDLTQLPPWRRNLAQPEPVRPPHAPSRRTQLPSWRRDLTQLPPLRNIYAYHLEQIRTGRWDFELQASKGRNALDAARLAIELAETQTAQRQESRQQFNQLILTVLGIALAVPQLIDREVAEALLLQAWNFIGLFLPLSNDIEIPMIFTVGLQIVFIFVVAWISILISRRILSEPRSRPEDRSAKPERK